MKKRQVLINAAMSLIQIVVTGGVLFILYKFLLNTIGVAQLGIWSLVLATTSVTQIANFGLSGSVVKFVAKYIALGEEHNVSGVIQTAAISVAAFVGSILAIAYPIIKWLLVFVIPDESVSLALSILPYAFFALWTMTITAIFQAGLDGYQRFDIRCFLLVGGAILNLLLCFVFAPAYGLIGVAYSRVLVNVFILIGSWVSLKRVFPLLPLFPKMWDRIVFRELLCYGINFQLISVIAMSYDPITKALLSKFGGLPFVGYYEMANQMIRQFRSLIVSANQVLVPAFAELKERTPDNIVSVYLKSYQLVFFLCAPLYSFIVVCSPIISELWIGHYENAFVFSTIFLSIGWFLNTLNAPAYFAYLGIGELRWNVLSHIVIGSLNVGFGLLLGLHYKAIGVTIAWAFSLGLGSSIVYLSYHMKFKIPLVELFPKSNRVILVACLLGILSNVIMRKALCYDGNLIFRNIIGLCMFLSIIALPVWFHPLRKMVAAWFFLLFRIQVKNV